MRIALDTNRYTDLVRGDPTVVSTVEDASEVVLPFAVVAELRYGFVRGTRPSENEQTLSKFLGRTSVRVIYPDDDTTKVYADLMLQLRRQGTPIPTNDVWIAAVTLQHDLALFARDRHFDHLAQLRRA